VRGPLAPCRSRWTISNAKAGTLSQSPGTQAKSPFDEQNDATNVLSETKTCKRVAPYSCFLSICYGMAEAGARRELREETGLDVAGPIAPFLAPVCFVARSRLSPRLPKTGTDPAKLREVELSGIRWSHYPRPR